MKNLKSCEFNMDTACVELIFTDGTRLDIDCIAVENEVAENLYQISALDYLIYNDPLKYANFIAKHIVIKNLDNALIRFSLS